jgi:copper chaperone NosL
LLLICLATVSLVACGSDIDFDQPPDIVYGEDVCERCSMIINEARYAAAYVTEDGEAHRFDDIGGMLARTEEASADVVVFWVHDFDSEEWLKAEEAHYVQGDHITPMGFGIIAFAEYDRAEAWAAEEGGMIMTFAELSGSDPMDEHDH